MICRSLDNLQIRDGKITKTKWKPSAPTLVSQIDVTMETQRDSSTAQSIISIDRQLGYKLQRSSHDSDLERAMENSVPR